MPELSPRSKRLLDEFDEAAQTWGWESDQGTGARVRNAEEVYTLTRRALMWRLLVLERRVGTRRSPHNPSLSEGIDQ